MSGLLDGKVVLVTGGANGIGRATAAMAAAQGARAVIVTDLSPEPRDGPAVETLVTGAGAAFHFARADITIPDELAAAVALAEPHGGLDLMVCNAGMAVANDSLEIDDAVYDRLIDVNLKGVFHSARAAARPMIARGAGGSIVITASMGGVLGSAGTLTYSATKGAARLYAQSLADALGPHGIRVNAVCPGVIETGFGPDIGEVRGMFDALKARTPLRRLGTADDVAGLIVWLGSDLASFVTGTSILVDGGLTAVI